LISHNTRVPTTRYCAGKGHLQFRRFCAHTGGGWRHAEVTGFSRKPVIMGEFGAFRSAYAYASVTAQALQQ